MASWCFPDIFSWIQNLPPISLWKTNSMSMCICSSSSTSPSLNLHITKNIRSSSLSFSITAKFNLSISLWVSKPMIIDPKLYSQSKFLDEESIYFLVTNFIEDVLKYGSNKSCTSLIKIPQLNPMLSNIKDIFNLVIFTLSLLICIYEAPIDIRSTSLNSLKSHLTSCPMRGASKSFMLHLGSNLEETWMRSINLGITNWIMELQSKSSYHRTLKSPSPLFSYAISSYGLWKVQLYCPVIAMDDENPSNPSADERLNLSLNYHQLDGVLQFNYKVVIQEKWVSVMVNIDNIRCDIIRLITENLMKERGVGAEEKYFPSRISLHITPTIQTNVMSLSVSKSTENQKIDIEKERNIEGTFETTNPFLGLKVGYGETTTTSIKPWKFEQSVYGYSEILNWFLHDSTDGREVVSSKPSKMAMINPKSWFKDRYTSAHRPFTRQGGVIFAGDEYGDKAWWKVDKSVVGKTMEWEIRGWIWLTYWPNKHKTFYTGTRRLEFRETVHLKIV
ncbi:hypothetical protein ACFE04_019066 [Oxalis oulophora]